MMDERDWDVIEALQQGIPLRERPFAELASGIGMTEAEFLERLRRLQEGGAVRRLGPRLAHYRAGIAGNVMAVWRVPPERIEECGRAFAAERSVSHCYVRPPFEGFDYTLYTMVHARDMDAAKQVVERLSGTVGIDDYVLLPTVQELKKTSPVYRRPAGDCHADR